MRQIAHPPWCVRKRKFPMERDTEPAAPGTVNIVQFNDVLRRRPSFAEVNQPITQSAGAPEGDDPPPDAV
jgi:hypothetical protein